jgi:hypothetical protein
MRSPAQAFGLFNLFLGIRDRDGAWEVNAHAKNLVDTQRVLTRDELAKIDP